MKAGLLCQTSDARSVECDGCGEACIEDVELVRYDDGTPPRAFVVCHEPIGLGRIAVALERLRQWTVELDALAGFLAVQLGAETAPEECVPGRLWWLGRPTLGETPTDLFLARGAGWDDAEAVFSQAPRLSECSEHVVLVLGDRRPGSGTGALTKTVSLACVLTLRRKHLRLDITEIERQSTGKCTGVGRDSVSADTEKVLVLRAGGLSATYCGIEVELSPTERRVLMRLAQQPDTPVATLDVAACAAHDGDPDTDSVRGVVYKIRRKLKGAKASAGEAWAAVPDNVIVMRRGRFGGGSCRLLLQAEQVEVS